MFVGIPKVKFLLICSMIFEVTGLLQSTSVRCCFDELFMVTDNPTAVEQDSIVMWIIFVEPACGQLDLAVTMAVWFMYVRASVRICLSRL